MYGPIMKNEYLVFGNESNWNARHSNPMKGSVKVLEASSYKEAADLFIKWTNPKWIEIYVAGRQGIQVFKVQSTFEAVQKS